MELNGIAQVWFFGSLGGVLVDVMKLATSRDKIPTKLKRIDWWVLSLALWIASGFVVIIEGVDHVPLARAVHLGIAAPALVAGWATASAAKKLARQKKGTRGGAFSGEARDRATHEESVQAPPSAFDLLGF